MRGLRALALVAACAVAMASGEASEARVTLTAARPALAEGLRIELVAVQDDRCPSDVQCVWAGHASVGLRVTRVGAPPQALRIGTPAPVGMQLPGDAEWAGWRFSLVSLDPLPTSMRKPALAEYAAIVQLSRTDR